MEQASLKRKGRPPGSRRKGLKKWEPISWKPIYEQFVALSVAGKSNIEIAAIFNYTPQQVCNVLTSEKAVEIKAGIIQGIRKKLGGTIDDRVSGIIDKTVSRAKELLDNDELFAKAPLSVVKVGLAVGTATGHLKNNPDKDSNNNNSPSTTVNNNLTVIGTSGISLLIDAIRKSDEAKRLNA